MFHHAVAALRSTVTRKEEGQGLVEYGLIIALIAVVAIAALILLGPAIGNLLNTATNYL